MKTTIVSFNFRRVGNLALVILLTGAIFTACKKSSSSTSTAITDDEVSEAITESVTSNSGGLVTQSESTTVVANSNSMNCGVTSDTTLKGASAPGAAITYSYTLNLSRTRVCTNGIPTQINCSATGSSSYSAPRMASADNSLATLTITGLLPTTSSYVLNGNYVRNGTQQSKVGLQRSFTSVLTFTSSNINVSKSTQKIISGSASVQYTGTITGGKTFVRGATITFLGNSQATLTLDNGTVINLKW